MRKNIYYYEPEWKYKIRLAFQLALPINDAWQIISISQSNSSHSKYVYLYHHNRVFPFRLSNHFNWQRENNRYTSLNWDQDENMNQLTHNISDVIVHGKAKSQKFDLKSLLLLQAVFSTHAKYDVIGVYLNNDDSLSVRHTTFGGPVNINNAVVKKLTQNLLRIRLLRVYHNTGYLNVTHNGKDFLCSYNDIREFEWPKKLLKFDWLSALSALDNLMLEERQIPILPNSVRRVPVPKADEKVYYQMFNVNYAKCNASSTNEDHHQTPKMWREAVVRKVKTCLPFGAQIISMLPLPRRRVVYFQIIRDNNLFLLRCGNCERERTTVSYVHHWYNIVIQEARDLTFSKINDLFQSHYLSLNPVLFAWLRYVQLCSDGDHRLFSNVDKSNVILFQRLANQYLIFPQEAISCLNKLQRVGWIEITSDGYQTTPLAEQIMRNYQDVARRHDMSWILKIPGLQLPDLVRYF